MTPDSTPGDCGVAEGDFGPALTRDEEGSSFL